MNAAREIEIPNTPGPIPRAAASRRGIATSPAASTHQRVRVAPRADRPVRGRRWAPRFWLGLSTGAFARLMWRNRFDVDLRYLYIAFIDGLVSPINSTLGLVERACFGPRLGPPPVDPLFILGHWRTGTTLLHELLALDPRHAAPTAYDCLAAHHFLLTRRVFPRLLRFLVPPRRPMDEMPVGLDSPFEDEFALCLSGVRSPYATFAFPNRGPMRPDMFDPDGFTAPQRRRWRAAMARFAAKLSLRAPGRRLVFKSPPHTCRIRALLEIFPAARFVHIVRNPYEVFPSMMHTWKTMHRTHGFQRPHDRGLEEMVYSIFRHLHACLVRDRPLIARGRYHELRYEDLVARPVPTLGALYDALSLGAFETVRPRIEAYVDARSHHVNRYELTPEQVRGIQERWGDIAELYGYQVPAAYQAPCA